MIFTLSAQSHLRVPFRFQNADKVVHTTEYCGLGLLVVRAARTLPRLQNAAVAGSSRSRSASGSEAPTSCSSPAGAGP